jgi:hypothetical protein
LNLSRPWGLRRTLLKQQGVVRIRGRRSQAFWEGYQQQKDERVLNNLGIFQVLATLKI